MSAIRSISAATSAGALAGLESGDPEASGPTVVLLHGWPESSAAWRPLMTAAGARHLVAFDLPGIGGSVDVRTDGSTTAVAALLDEALASLGLDGVVLVGHDFGGMTAWAMLRAHPSRIGAVVIADTVVPGVEPWTAVHANPWVWHFRFHAIPNLPETLVAGRERAYFDFFFDVLGGATRVPDSAREAAVDAYRDPRALAAGFDWYRGLDSAAAWEHGCAGDAVDVPLTYIRGEHEGGEMGAYLAGFRAAGVRSVESVLITGCGHFTLDEAPEALWESIAAIEAPATS